jgi:alpha-galactosidase
MIAQGVKRVPKTVIIGAGSIVFARRLILDLLAYPELRDGTIALVDLDPDRLEVITSLAKHVVALRKHPTRIESTTDRGPALDGADHVITAINVGHDAVYLDHAIPQKHGVLQQVADTIGPGGVFRGLRAGPALLAICRDMERLCPDAWLLNYTNPMAIVTWAINAGTRVKAVGLCHSVQGTSHQLAGYIGVPYDEVSYWVAGINHMAWFLSFTHRGEDAYPRLREAMADPETYARDRVRFEILRHFDYFVTESTPHMSEYVPYFRRTAELVSQFGLRTPSLDRSRWSARWEKHRESVEKQIAGEEPIPDQPSTEYAAGIVHSLVTGTLRRINGNVLNRGLITNLPEGCCVEVPCLVDGTGLRPCYVGGLPPQCAALNRGNIALQELAAQAIVERDRRKAFQAVCLDPLTAAVLTLGEIRQMVHEMLDAEAEWLWK